MDTRFEISSSRERLIKLTGSRMAEELFSYDLTYDEAKIVIGNLFFALIGNSMEDMDFHEYSQDNHYDFFIKLVEEIESYIKNNKKD